jgi:tetratricopeptide (TPR) repeat protein
MANPSSVNPSEIDNNSVLWDELIASAEQSLSEENYDVAGKTLFSAMELAYDFGEADIRFVYTLDKLAECLWHCGQLDDAENYCKQLIRIHESVLEADPVNIASFFNNLAILKHAGKNFDEAEKYYKRALKGKEKALGTSHPEVLRIKSNYADLLHMRGRVDEAQKISTSSRVVTVRDWQRSTISLNLKKIPAEDSKSFQPAPSSPRIEEQPNEERSVPLTREDALLIWEVNKNAAEQAQQKGDHEACEKLWLLALKVLEVVADKSVELTYTLDSLAQLAHSRNDYMEAIRLSVRSYDLKVKVLGLQNPVVAKAADALARMHYLVSDYEHAEPFAKKCLEYYEKMGETDTIEVGCALHNLATLYHVQRKYEDAEPLYKRALAIKTKVFGEGHPDTLRLMRSYGHVLSATNQQTRLGKNSQMITGSWKSFTLDSDAKI